MLLQQGTGHEIEKRRLEIMLKKQAKSLAELIGSDGSGFAQLADAARLRADLGDYLRNNLDPELSGGVVHCNIRDDDTLTVTAASPEWAARLRFEGQKIIGLCRKRGMTVRNIKVRVGS